jgi:hypothetical protein
MSFELNHFVKKTDPFNLTIFRQQVLKGPDRLLRMEIMLKIAKTYTLQTKDKFQKLKPSFEDATIHLSLVALNEIIASIIWRHHSLSYEIPVDKFYDHLEHIFLKNNDVESAAIMLLFKKKDIECTTRVWTREIEYARKVDDLTFHYGDMRSVAPTLKQLREGHEKRNAAFNIKPITQKPVEK